MSEEVKEVSVRCEALGDWKRSHTCGALTLADDGAEVCLMGWVQYRRDHGGLIFVDLRDRYGLTQRVCRENQKLYKSGRVRCARNTCWP